MAQGSNMVKAFIVLISTKFLMALVFAILGVIATGEISQWFFIAAIIFLLLGFVSIGFFFYVRKKFPHLNG